MVVMSTSLRKGGKFALYMNVCNLPMICKSVNGCKEIRKVYLEDIVPRLLHEGQGILLCDSLCHEEGPGYLV